MRIVFTVVLLGLTTMRGGGARGGGGVGVAVLWLMTGTALLLVPSVAQAARIPPGAREYTCSGARNRDSVCNSDQRTVHLYVETFSTSTEPRC